MNELNFSIKVGWISGPIEDSKAGICWKTYCASCQKTWYSTSQEHAIKTLKKHLLFDHKLNVDVLQKNEHLSIQVTN